MSIFSKELATIYKFCFQIVKPLFSRYPIKIEEVFYVAHPL